MTERKREFDIVVWGATGFTGGLVAEYVVSRYGARGSAVSADEPALRIALGGRNAGKLETVRAALAEHDEKLDVVVADAADQASVDAVVRRTRVVISTAGPFARFGSSVVSACARLGTDYVDITGEAHWAARMIAEHEEEARGSGAVLVSMCGFDSVPADLSAFMLNGFARGTVGSPLAEVTSHVTATGGISGGTLASMSNIMADPEARKQLSDEFLLNPPDRRPAAVRPHDRPVLTPKYDADERAYGLPFVMSGVNNKVVRRSAALLGYGDAFSYNERMSVRSLPVAIVTYLAMILFLACMAVAPLRALLERFVLPAPGTGPSAKQRAKSRFRYRVRAKTVDGTGLVAVVAGKCPGYGDTAKMLGESGVTLARRRSNPVPANKRAGFHTPASAMGDVLVGRLVRAGMTLSVGRA